MLIKAEARVDRVGIAELASVEGASGTISQGGMVAVAGGQWGKHGGSSMPFGRAMRHGARRCLLDVQQLPTLSPQRLLLASFPKVVFNLCI